MSSGTRHKNKTKYFTGGRLTEMALSRVKTTCVRLTEIGLSRVKTYLDHKAINKKYIYI